MSGVPTPEPSGRYRLIIRIGLVVLGVIAVAIGVVRIGSGILGSGDGLGDASAGVSRTINPQDYIDEHGHVLLSALIELDGTQIVTLLTGNGYRMDEQEGVPKWISADDSSTLVVSAKDGGYLGTDAFVSLPCGGGSRPVTFELSLVGYGSTASALDDVGQMDVEQRRDVAINASVMTLVSESGDRFLCRVALSEDGVTKMLLCNEEAISAGALVRYGTTIDAVYENLISSKRVVETQQLSEEDADLPDPPSSLTEDCFDDRGNLTVYAICELTGAELVQALESEGYAYDTDVRAFMTEDQNARFAVLDADLNSLSRESIAMLERGGGSMPVAFVLHTTGYASAREMMDGLGKCTLRDRKAINDHMTCAVMSSPSARDMLVSVSNPTDKGLLVMHVMSNEAVAAGMVDKMSQGDPKAPVTYGTTIADVWQKLAGVPVGDYMRENPEE